jgi:hypothetical protein
VAVDVDQLEALAALDEDGVAADRPHRPDGGVHPSRQQPRRTRVEAFGSPSINHGLRPCRVR